MCGVCGAGGYLRKLARQPGGAAAASWRSSAPAAAAPHCAQYCPHSAPAHRAADSVYTHTHSYKLEYY